MTMKGVLRCLSCVCVVSALLLPAAGVQAQNDQRTLERQLAKKRAELKKASGERRKVDSQRGVATKELRAVDQQVGQTVRELAVTQQRIATETDNLQKLSVQQQALQSTLSTQVKERQALLQAAYRNQRSGPLKAMLSQDSVAKSQRNLTYHRYLQQDRRARIGALNRDLSGLDKVQGEINGRKADLARNMTVQRQQQAQLERDRASRALVVGKLNKQYADASQREKSISKDVAGLNKLLTQLRAAAAKADRERKAIAAQRAREAAAARRAEQQRLAREAAAAKKANASAARSGKATASSSSSSASSNAAVTADTPVRAPKVVASVARPSPATGPAVGGMGWPANGALLAGFGATMPDGRRSQGLLIGASRGSPVRAVASGQVVYAQWMTGYGQLLIIDHGGGRMSLYAYNDSLLKSVGDTVSRGDTVATVGASGGQGTPALYFELRSNGSPVNPRSMMQ